MPGRDKDEAAFCLSTDVESAAYKATKAAIEAMGGQGNLVHLTGNKVDSNTQRRIAGVQKAVDETGGKVKLVQTITDIDVDLQSAQKAVADLLAARGKDLQGIVTTAYNRPSRPRPASSRPGCRSRSSPSTTTRPSSPASPTARWRPPSRRTPSVRATSVATR